MNRKNNRIFNRFTVLIMLLIMAVAVTACSKGKAGGDKPQIDKDKIESVGENSDQGSKDAEDKQDAASDTTAAPVTDAPAVSNEEEQKKEELKPVKQPADSEEGELNADIKSPANIEIELTSEYEYKYDDELNTTLGHYKYQTVSVSNLQDDILPELDTALRSFTGVADDVVDSTLSNIAENAKMDEVYDDQYYEKVMYTPTRADTNLVSLNYSYETYKGGAHGMYGTFSYSFDPVTGEMHKVIDLLKDRDAFVDFIYDRLIADYEEELMYEDKDTLRDALVKMLDEDRLPVEFGYDHASVIINPYEMFAYALGQVFINIPYKNNEGMFIDEVINSAENYMYPLDDWREVREDFGDIGEVGNLSIYPNYINDDFDFDSLNVYMNNEMLEGDFDLGDISPCYGLDPVFVHVDGRDFIYINYWYCSDDSWSYVYEIVADKTAGDGTGYSMVKTDIEPGSFFEDLTTYDPKYADMSFRYDIIGTNYISAHYELSADKEPVMVSDEYFFEFGDMTAKKEITMTVADPGGDLKTGDTVTVAPGTELGLFSTDGASYIDFIAESMDWAILRIPVKKDEYNSFRMEDGSAFDDWFDGIAYYD